MDEEKAVQEGLLLLPSKEKLLKVKKPHRKYCLLYKASKQGIERIEIFDSADEASKLNAVPYKIITLEDCVKVSKKTDTYFSVVTKSGTYDFQTHTEIALKQWISALQIVAFKEDPEHSASLVEDNDLYCSIGEGTFNVKLYETDASIRCNLLPKNYILMLTATAIQLREVSDDALLFTWPYQFVRRYGYSEGKFTFEAGRKCDSGEGKFLLEHSNEQEIFRYVTMKMKSMKKLLKTDSMPNLDCGDKQLLAVLNMEAKSRSPLPPSPTTSTSLQDFSQEFSAELPKVLNYHPIVPPKPPRKHLPVKDDYEPIENYDQVEIRKNAWQTFGMIDVNHMENVDSEEDLIQWGRKSPIFESKISKAAKVITDVEESDEYDKLNFFGSTSKLDMAGYKQVRAQNNNLPSPPSFNEYDEVHLLESKRPADDSHLGYALIRKKENPVVHKSFNDTEYAVISKPKRV
ncbi:PREDICTED: docking protein 2 [Nicrophorus vespilloides]|uniref:Docking protein 2 n=1 Tax=Nicrophorus vespilloides TaxID=110193 RepID=A0ABM1N8V2_NICVS|nr:PREDICTED: docking protein 2 [Nicrophorus vespilloides]